MYVQHFSTGNRLFNLYLLYSPFNLLMNLSIHTHTCKYLRICIAYECRYMRVFTSLSRMQHGSTTYTSTEPHVNTTPCPALLLIPDTDTPLNTAPSNPRVSADGSQLKMTPDTTAPTHHRLAALDCMRKGRARLGRRCRHTFGCSLALTPPKKGCWLQQTH